MLDFRSWCYFIWKMYQTLGLQMNPPKVSPHLGNGDLSSRGMKTNSVTNWCFMLEKSQCVVTMQLLSSSVRQRFKFKASAVCALRNPGQEQRPSSRHRKLFWCIDLFLFPKPMLFYILGARLSCGGLCVCLLLVGFLAPSLQNSSSFPFLPYVL